MGTELERQWSDGQPIYRQIREMLVEMILERVVQEGESLPPTRQMAADFGVSPLTVLKGYQKLVDEGVVEARRGLGMFVKQGAHKKLLAAERERFVNEEWPRVRTAVDRLGLDPKELFR